MSKPRIVFLFVEAGLGHIMPMKAIADAFEDKYGDKAEVVRTYFYQDKNNSNMQFVESELVREVKKHNANRLQGAAQFALLKLLGTRLCMGYVFKVRYERGFSPSLEYLKELNADVLVHTHFSTLFCSCEARKKGLINSKIVTYCPDPIAGLQWDSKTDLIGLSNSDGVKKAKRGRFKNAEVAEVPFLIRKTVADMNEGKEHYKRELGFPVDNFTVLLADGAYGVGRLRETVLGLLKTKERLTLAVVCGKNKSLYNELSAIQPPDNIHLALYGFTDKTLQLAAACDLFVGKAGASNLAEPAYFGAPQIINFRATKVEEWIANHYIKAGSAILEENIKKAIRLVEDFARNPSILQPYVQATQPLHRHDGAEQFADIIWNNYFNKE